MSSLGKLRVATGVALILLAMWLPQIVYFTPLSLTEKQSMSLVVRAFIEGSEVYGADVTVSFPAGGYSDKRYDYLPDQKGKTPFTITFDYPRGFHVIVRYGNYEAVKWWYVYWWGSPAESIDVELVNTEMEPNTKIDSDADGIYDFYEQRLTWSVDVKEGSRIENVIAKPDRYYPTDPQSGDTDRDGVADKQDSDPIGLLEGIPTGQIIFLRILLVVTGLLIIVAPYTPGFRKNP